MFTQMMTVLQKFCSYICHQIPERCFCIHGAPLPLCARCTGAFLGIVALVGVCFSKRTRAALSHRKALWFLGALGVAFVSILEIALESAGYLSTSNGVRFILGLSTTMGLGIVAIQFLIFNFQLKMVPRQLGFVVALFAVAIFIFGNACGGGGGGGGGGGAGGGGSGAASIPAITPGNNLPGVVVAITSVVASDGKPINVGSFLSVTFSVKDKSGNDLFPSLVLAGASNYASGQILMSGPTSNYQRVLGGVPGSMNEDRMTDVLTKAKSNGNGTYTYTFANAIPATYLYPMHNKTVGPFSTAYRNYTGDMQGMPLQDGTYTVGLILYTFYSVNGVTVQDIGSATQDLTISVTGLPVTLTKREEVLDANCNQCHTSIRYHGAAPANLDHTANTTTMCVLCHTSGAVATDGPLSTDGTINNATNQFISFRHFIHQIHDSANLPSVNGVGVNSNGSRNYGATPVPYFLVDSSGISIKVQFPVMPRGMPHRYGVNGTVDGYDSLTPNPNQGLPEDGGQMAQEKAILQGIYKCDKCHKNAAQGNVYLKTPSRHACDSCHDDMDYTQTAPGHPYPYNNNGFQMPPQTDDSACATCHVGTNDQKDLANAHMFPLDNPALNPGVNAKITGVQNQAGTDLTATGASVGDNMKVTFTLKDNSGNDIGLPTLDIAVFTLAGPTISPQAIIPFPYKGVAAFDAFPATQYRFVTNGVNEPQGATFDKTLRKGSPFTGNGTITKPTVAVGATRQIIAIVFKNAGANFDVLGYDPNTVTNPNTGAIVLAANQVTPGTGNSITATVDGGKVSFTITTGSTPFATDDRWYYEVYPPAAPGGSYTEYIPMDLPLEFLGNTTGGANVFNTAYKSLYWGRQVVYEGTVTATATTLSSAVSAYGRYLPVASTTGFSAGNCIVIDRGAGIGTEEYVKIGYVDTVNNVLRLQKALRYAHASGKTVTLVTLATKREGSGSQYTVTDAKGGAGNLNNGDAGQITLVAGQFTSGNPVLIDYRCRFAIPAVYQSPPNDSPNLAQSWGKWTGLALQDGTYMLNMEACKVFDVGSDANKNKCRYRASSPSTLTYFLIGATATYAPRTVISSDSNCNACHEKLGHHEGVYKGGQRREFSTCMMCHTIPGIEDFPKYFGSVPYFAITGQPADTTGITVDMRTFMHKVHSGMGLPNATNYVVTSDELDQNTYEDIRFPAMPGGVQNCEKCHGVGNTAYMVPADRDHPAQTTPTLKWTNVCLACHQDNDVVGAIDNTVNAAAESHVALNTYGSSASPELTFTGLKGVEACNTCHGTGTTNRVDLVHKVYGQ